MKVKKQNCKHHEWRILKELSPQDKRLIGADVEVKCIHCKKHGYVKWSNLEWIKHQ